MTGTTSSVFKPDFHRAAIFVLRTFREGKLGLYNLDIQVVKKLKKLDQGKDIERTPSQQKQATKQFKELLKDRLHGQLPEKYIPASERQDLDSDATTS